MSRIEKAAAPILTSMVKDEACIVARPKQEAIARWIMLKALVAFRWPPTYSLDLDTLQNMYAALEAWSGVSKALNGVSAGAAPEPAPIQG